MVVEDLLIPGLFPLFQVFLSLQSFEDGPDPAINMPFTQILSPTAEKGMETIIPSGWSAPILIKLKITSSIYHIKLLPQAGMFLQVTTSQGVVSYKSSNLLRTNPEQLQF